MSETDFAANNISDTYLAGKMCSDLILIFLKFASDQNIESTEYFQLCYLQIIQIFPCFTLIMFGQNHETFSSVCSIVVTF